jgi:hypothetical protein
LETTIRLAYEAPEIVGTFNAQEIMGAAEGLVANGSTCELPIS